MNGTPKTLDEAIIQAICIGPVKDVREHLYSTFRDFIAQKFQAAYLKADKKELEILQDPFEQLTRREE